jgi:integrase
MEFALDNEWIDRNPLSDIRFDRRLFKQKAYKTAETEVFDAGEKEKLIGWCMSEYRRRKDGAYLVPVLSLSIGTRVGETVALKWSDVIGERRLLVSRTEIMEHDTRRRYVAEHTKSHRTRTVDLSARALDTLAILRRDAGGSEWVFQRCGERVTARAVAYVLKQYSEKTGKPMKSSHKLRKTYASDLFAAGVSAATCAKEMGHSDLKTFFNHYCYAPETDEATYRLINSAV